MVVIVAILAAIAYPAYTAQVQETRQSEAKGKMMDLAASLEGYRAKNFSYESAQLATLSPNLNSSSYYTVTLTVDGSSNHQAYKVKAVPISSGVMDGTETLVLNEKGQTCMAASACTPSSSTSW